METGRGEIENRAFPPYLLEHIETMSRSALEQLQERRLLRQIAFTYERGALTRKVWDEAGLHPSQIKSLDDYRAKAPFINKDSIRQFRDENGDPAGGVDCTHPRELVGVGTTSGTTGDPTPLPRTARAVSDMTSLRDYWRIGVRPGDYIAHMLFIFRGGIAYRSIREHNIIPIHFTHSPHELKRLFDAIPIYRPTLLRNVSNPMLLANRARTRASSSPASWAPSSAASRSASARSGWPTNGGWSCSSRRPSATSARRPNAPRMRACTSMRMSPSPSASIRMATRR
jgi:phenylacetate-CoA ligase